MFYLPIKRNVLFLKTVCIFGVCLDSQQSPGVPVGTASAVQSRAMDGDPWECKPISVGAAESHPRSSFHPHPFSWVSIAPVGLCSEPDWAREPATNYFCKESSYRSARSASWTGSLCYYAAIAAAREGWVLVERTGGKSWEHSTLHVGWLVTLWNHHPSE